MKEIPSDPLKFASLIAHQLKAPVEVVSSILKTVLGEFAGPLTAQQRNLLEKAVLRCDDSLLAAQRLLAISRAIENPESFKGQADIAKIVRDAKSQYIDKAAENRIQLWEEIDVQPLYVQGSDVALSEVVRELIKNATKYTPQNGKIQLRVGIDEKTQTAEVSISDSGIGIAEEDKENIFKPFFRTTSASISAIPGTGLGLTMVKTLVEAIGGNIGVGKSGFGGTQFTIRLKLDTSMVAVGEKEMKKPLRVIIIGGVAAGPKVASKICRLQPAAEVTIIEKGKLMSYAGCGLPYYISGVVKDQRKLMSTPVGELRDPVFFQKVKNIRVMNLTEAIEIDRKNKRVLVRESTSQQETWLEYDKLVMATGGKPKIPPIDGLNCEQVYSLHGVSDAEGIKATLEKGGARDVLIIGGGLIGIEMTESLVKKGCRVTIAEMRSQILPMFDWEIAKLIERYLETQGIKILTDTQVKALKKNGHSITVTTNTGEFPTDMVILAAGIEPNTGLAQKAGLKIGVTGGIVVDKYMKTNDPDIYAAGDCVENISMQTGKSRYVPLGSTANKQGRVVAVNICGGKDEFPGILGTIACQAFDYGMGRTGLSEQDAKSLGHDVVSVLCPGPDREHFVPGAKTLMLKMIVDKNTRKILGVQTTGPGNGDKRIDVAVMAIAAGMTVDQLAQMDLCYAPAFSPVMDNLITASNVARNKLDGQMIGVPPMQVYDMLKQGRDIILLDVRTDGEFEQYHLRGSSHIPLGSLRARIKELPKDKEIVAFCNYSLRGYEASVILRHAGLEKVSVMDGGLAMWPYSLD